MSDPREAQRALWDAIHAGTSVDAKPGADHFVGDARLDAAGRMNIYAEAFEARVLEAMETDFAWTAQLIGHADEAFARTVRDYVQAHPIQTFELSAIGDNFPDFLATRTGRADIAEVARLEWLRAAVAMAADVATLGIAALSAQGQAIVDMSCSFAPTMRHATVGHDVCAVVDALVVGSAPPPPPPRPAPCELVAWRRGDRVFHTALGGPAAEALRLAARGENIAAVCDTFAACREPAREAFTALGAWFADGWVQHLGLRE